MKRFSRLQATFLNSVRFAHITRNVDPNGFHGDVSVRLPTGPSRKPIPTVDIGKNVLLTGCANTGKLTTLKALGKQLEDEGKKVAWVSADPGRAVKLGGLPYSSFLGLKAGAKELPIREQMEATFERHIRLMEDRYEAIFPCLASTDVLVLDSIHLLEPVVVQSIDSVCRRVRNNEGEPFGGLRVLASADFWKMEVHPESPYHGYMFQLPEFDELFPQQTLLTKSMIHDNAELSALTQRALMGTLSAADIDLLESLPADEGFTPIVDNLAGFMTFQPKFPRQPSRRAMPTRAKQIRGNDFGSFLLSALSDGFFAQHFGLVDKLSLNVGDPVHLTHDGEGFRAGTRGVVEEILPFRVRVRFGEKKTINIAPMRVEVSHPEYHDVKYTLTQFPLFPRTDVSPMNLIKFGNVSGVSIDCGLLTDTNDLGNILAQTRSLKDLHIVPGTTTEFTKLEGIVHEPTRIYYQHLADRTYGSKRTTQQFCRNCKKYFPDNEFYAHWNKCVAEQKWCSETDQVVPMNKWEPHNEKLQIVMCIDCGKALEWKNWELHRLSCNPMLREVTSENEFLPVETRNNALAMGFDRRDLHSMKAISKGSMPKTRRDVRSKAR